MTLVLPLRRLSPAPEQAPEPEPAPGPAPEPVARTLHLDRSPVVEAWAARVREAGEAMLLLDAAGRLVALSAAAGELLGLDATASAGALLLDLVQVVDFTAAAVPVPDPEVQLPPLRAIATGRLNRGLVRLQSGHLMRSYDVVGVPLSDAAGAVAFLATV